jgi:hypothetical protein
MFHVPQEAAHSTNWKITWQQFGRARGQNMVLPLKRRSLLDVQKCSNISASAPNEEERVRPILTTLMLVGCISIGGCPDLGNAQSGGEPRVQGQSNKGSRGESGGQRPVRTACKAEIEKLCSGEAQAGRCLRNRNPEELSEECKAALANRGSR